MPDKQAASPLLDWSRLTATTALQQLQDGRLTTSALVASCQQRIDQYNPMLNALITLNREPARQAACAMDTCRERGMRLPPLQGLPVSIKDSFCTRDLRTTASFRPLQHYQPTADATAVARLRAAGAILMGKSNLPELAGAPHCWSPLFGLTHNPWDLARTPGGSSGGAAAAIAAGFSLLEIGSDLAGSIRIPAAYCGIAGLKASEGRIPRTGHIPHLPAHLGKTGRSVWHMLSMGVLARSVADLQLGYRLIAGPDGMDSTVIPFPPAAPQPDIAPPPGLRLALWDDFATPCSPAIEAGLHAVETRLRSAGLHVVRCAPADFDLHSAWETFGLLAGSEVGLGMPGWQAKLGSWLRHVLPAGHVITHSLSRGLALDLHLYNQALNQREQLMSALENFLDQWDAVLCPVAPVQPYPGQAMPQHRPPPRIRVGSSMQPYLEATLSMTVPFSVTGNPVVVLPSGSIDSLPFGVQLIGRRWQDDALLHVAAQLEKVLGGFVAPPWLSDA